MNLNWEEFLELIAKYKDGATIAGEMQMQGLSLSQDTVKVDDIPVSPSVNYDQLIEGDDSPLEVVVEMPVGKSKRGWNYTEEVVRSIVKQVNEKTTAGFKGHQKAENVSTEFLDPATHWIGATYDEGTKKAFFRGYVDPNEKNLRRWITSGRIKETSIFGQMHLKKVAGETHVVDCDLMSIDWTPLGRPGMSTQVVDVKIAGEMNEPEGGSSMNREELLQAIRTFLSENNIEARELVGEMDQAFIAQVNTMEAQLPALREALNLPADATFEQVQAKVAELNKLEAEKAQAELQALTQEVIAEKLPDNEDAQKLAGEMFTFTGTTKEAIAGEMDNFLSKPVTKSIFDNLMTDNVPSARRNNKSTQTYSGVRAVRKRLN